MKLNKNLINELEERRIIKNDDNSLFYCCDIEEIEHFKKYDNVVIFKEVENTRDINYIENYDYIVMIKSENMRE